VLNEQTRALKLNFTASSRQASFIVIASINEIISNGFLTGYRFQVNKSVEQRAPPAKQQEDLRLLLKKNLAAKAIPVKGKLSPREISWWVVIFCNY
jgi:hypothetical protein